MFPMALQLYQHATCISAKIPCQRDSSCHKVIIYVDAKLKQRNAEINTYLSSFILHVVEGTLTILKETWSVFQVLTSESAFKLKWGKHLRIPKTNKQTTTTTTTYTHTCMHGCTHACTHARTHAHTHTLTYTYKIRRKKYWAKQIFFTERS